MKTLVNKITSEQIMEWEKEALVDAAFSGAIELNDEFLERFCEESFVELMKKIPESDRAYVLDGVDYSAFFNGTIAGKDSDLWLNVSEIEYQFDGDPEEVFENPEEFTINADLSYLYVGYGLSIDFDRKELLVAIAEYLEE
jgi:hypothetical protein